MTEGINENRSKVVPFAVGGAAVGGLGGWGLTKTDWLKKPAYTSWEDIVNESNKDNFTKNVEVMEGLEEADRTKATELYEKLENADKEWEKAEKEYIEQNKNVTKTAELPADNELVKQKATLEEKIKTLEAGTKVEGATTKTTAGEVKVDTEALNKAKAELTELESKITEARGKLTTSEVVPEETLKEQFAKLNGAKEEARKKTGDAIKGELDKFVNKNKVIKGGKMWAWIGGGAAALGILSAIIAPKNKQA